MFRYCVWYVFLFFFFFKQKTAYEMRISDWSSDVCSSDLLAAVERPGEQLFIAVDPRPRSMFLLALRRQEIGGDHRSDHARDRQADEHREPDGQAELDEEQIGRASCRVRVCQCV